MSNRKARLTRRVKQQYVALLQGDSRAWSYPFPGQQYLNQPGGASYRYRNEWGAYVFAKRWLGRSDVDLKRLQLIVIRSQNPECALKFAEDIPGANLRRLQGIVINFGNSDQMRRFARKIPGADQRWLEAAASVAEVMEW